MARTQHLKLMQQEQEAVFRPAFPEDLESVSSSREPLPCPEEPEQAADQIADAEENAAGPDDPSPEAGGPLPDGISGEMVCRTQEDLAAYPDAAYETAEKPRRRGRISHKRRKDEKEAPPEEEIPASAPAHGRGLWTLLALFSAALLFLVGSSVFRWRQAYRPFREKVNIVAKDTIAQGVLVDGVHVGGMTREEAARALQTDAVQQEAALHITVRADDQTWIITPKELPYRRNTSQVLDTAYAVGRQGTRETVASSVTPFEYRYQHLYHTVGSPVSLHTQASYDPADVRGLVRIVESYINRDAVDAQIATFDFSSRAFTFTEDRAGAHLDGDDLYNRIVSALDRRDFQAVIAVESQVLTPRVTKAELMNAFSLVSSYTTETTSNANRNINIDLACRAVNGTVVMPGETFSFNQTTGQRTSQKGYLPAAAISGGATVDEIGGGVCQVSSTLFNAAVMADMTVLARSPHTWPSNYVEKGRDATVNWPNLDFSFRNDQSNPVFIAAWYEKRKCTVEIYGAVMSGGQSIDLDTQLMDTIPPPEEPIMERNPALEPGTVREKKKARTGYLVDTYKVYKRNGREVKRELLCISEYKMIQQVMEYN